MKRLACVLIVVQMALVSVASAQSLGDIARREEARRKQIKHPARLYTNKDLKDEGVPPLTPAPAVEAPAAESAPPAPAEATEEPQKDEAAAAQQQWHDRMAQARDQLDRSKMFAEALQTRSNSLWADFTARDDPAQRAVIEAERRKTLAELDRVKAEIEAQTKAVSDLEEEARKAGVPPGWLR